MCSCRRTVHCSTVSLCYDAAEFTVILYCPVQIHTFIYIQIPTMHIVLPSLQQPAVSKYMHILSYTCIYHHVRASTNWCICTYLVYVSVRISISICTYCTYLYVLKASKSVRRIDTCKYVQYVAILAYIDEISTQIRANIYKYIQNMYILGGVQNVKKVRIHFWCSYSQYMYVLLRIYIRIGNLRAYTY